MGLSKKKKENPAEMKIKKAGKSRGIHWKFSTVFFFTPCITETLRTRRKTRSAVSKEPPKLCCESVSPVSNKIQDKIPKINQKIRQKKMS